nr:hypothetical protein Iba_chr15aCG3100 [Ipomoea batatas]
MLTENSSFTASDGGRSSDLAQHRHVCAASASKLVHFSGGAHWLFSRRICGGENVSDEGVSGWHCKYLVTSRAEWELQGLENAGWNDVELIGAQIHESFGEYCASAIAVDLELAVVVRAGAEPAGEGVVVDEGSGEGAFEAVDGDGGAEEVEVFDGESEEVLIVEVGEGEGVGWGFGGGRD